MTILINLLLVIWMVVAGLMILVILMQRPKSEGLGAAFGGAVTENIFGAQTTNVLTKITGWLAGIFFALTFALSILYAHRAGAESALSRELKKSAALPQSSASPIVAVSPSPGASASVAAAAASASAAHSASVKPADVAVGAVPAASPSASTSPAPQKK